MQLRNQAHPQAVVPEQSFRVGARASANAERLGQIGEKCADLILQVRRREVGNGDKRVFRAKTCDERVANPINLLEDYSTDRSQYLRLGGCGACFDRGGESLKSSGLRSTRSP